MNYSFLFKSRVLNIFTYTLYIALAVSIIYYLFPPVILAIVWFIGSLYYIPLSVLEVFGGYEFNYWSLKIFLIQLFLHSVLQALIFNR